MSFVSYLEKDDRKISGAHRVSNVWIRGSKCYGLSDWGLVAHIFFGNLTIIGSDNGLSPDRRQAITWASAEISFMGPLKKLQWNLKKNHTFSFKRMRLKTSSANRRPFCLGLNVLKKTQQPADMILSCYIYTGPIVSHSYMFRRNKTLSINTCN